MVTIQLTDSNNNTLTIACKNSDVACDIALAVVDVAAKGKSVEGFIVRQMVKGKVVYYTSN